MRQRPDTTSPLAVQPVMLSQSYDLARAYVHALTGSLETLIDVRMLDDTKQGLPPQLQRGTITELWPWIVAENETGRGAFVTVNETDGQGRKAENIVSARATWVDCDGADAEQQLDRAARFDPPPSFIVRTSQGKGHAYWRLPTGTDAAAAETLTRKLAVEFHGDMAATDRARILRLAGTLHRKGEPVLVTVESAAGFGSPVPLERLEGALRHVVVSVATAGARNPLGTLPTARIEVVEAALDEIDPPTEYDEWRDITAAYRGAGGRRPAWDVWTAKWKGQSNPANNDTLWRSLDGGTSLGWERLRTLAPIASARHSFGDEPYIPPKPSGARARRGANDASCFLVHVLDGDDSPPQFHVENLVPEDAMVMIYGAPKTGKSFVAIDIAASVATGEPFHCHQTRKGPVVYIAGEGLRAIKQRFRAWESVRGVSLADAPLVRSQHAIQVLDVGSAAMVADAVDTFAATHGTPKLIVIDTLARNFGDGDENNTRDMSRFISELDKLRWRYPGCSAIIVHHSGVMDNKRARGNSALLGAMDAEFRVEPGPVLRNTNMKESAIQPAMAFSMIEAVGSAALEYSGTPKGSAGTILTATATMTMDAFRTAAVDGCATDDGWRAAFYEMRSPEEKPDTSKAAFQRGKKLLLENGYLLTDGDNFKIPPMPGTLER